MPLIFLTKDMTSELTFKAQPKALDPRCATQPDPSNTFHAFSMLLPSSGVLPNTRLGTSATDCPMPHVLCKPSRVLAFMLSPVCRSFSQPITTKSFSRSCIFLFIQYPITAKMEMPFSLQISPTKECKLEIF